MVNFMPLALYPVFHRTGGWVSPRASLDISLPGSEPKPSSLQQVPIPNIVLQLLLNYQFNRRIQIGQMQPVACHFVMPVVHAAIAGLFTKVVILVIYAVI